MVFSKWKFRTKNFHVYCEEYQPNFVDPWAHGKNVADVVDSGEAILTHMKAVVYFHGVEIGEARLLDCIYVFASSDVPHLHDRLLVTDHSYRRKAVRAAVADARAELAKLRGAWTGPFIRKTP